MIRRYLARFSPRTARWLVITFVAAVPFAVVDELHTWFGFANSRAAKFGLGLPLFVVLAVGLSGFVLSLRADRRLGSDGRRARIDGRVAERSRQ